MLQVVSNDEYALICDALNRATADILQPCASWQCLLCIGCCVAAGLRSTAEARTRTEVAAASQQLSTDFAHKRREIEVKLTANPAFAVLVSVAVAAGSAPVAVVMYDTPGQGYVPSQQPAPYASPPPLGYGGAPYDPYAGQHLPPLPSSQPHLQQPYPQPYPPPQQYDIHQQQQQQHSQPHMQTQYPPFDPQQQGPLNQPYVQQQQPPPYAPPQGLDTCPRCGVHLAPALMAHHASKCRV